MDQLDGRDMTGDTLHDDTMAATPDRHEPAREAAVTRLASACAALYRKAVSAGDATLYDAAAVLAALQEQTAALQPTSLSRIQAALEAARHAHQLDCQLRAAAHRAARHTPQTIR